MLHIGIRKGDIIVKLDGQRITSYAELQDVLQYYKVGETIVVTVERLENGEYVPLDIEITLGSRPQE